MHKLKNFLTEVVNGNINKLIDNSTTPFNIEDSEYGWSINDEHISSDKSNKYQGYTCLKYFVKNQPGSTLINVSTGSQNKIYVRSNTDYRLGKLSEELVLTISTNSNGVAELVIDDSIQVNLKNIESGLYHFYEFRNPSNGVDNPITLERLWGTNGQKYIMSNSPPSRD